MLTCSLTLILLFLLSQPFQERVFKNRPFGVLALKIFQLHLLWCKPSHRCGICQVHLSAGSCLAMIFVLCPGVSFVMFYICSKFFLFFSVYCLIQSFFIYQPLTWESGRSLTLDWQQGNLHWPSKCGRPSCGWGSLLGHWQWNRIYPYCLKKGIFKMGVKYTCLWA